MTPRDRQLAAIRHELADRVSTDVIWIENMDRISAYLGIAEAEIPDRLGLDGRIVEAPFIGDLPRDGDELTVWGTSVGGEYGTSVRHPFAVLRDRSQIERHRWPDPDDFDYHAARREAEKLNETYAVRGPSWDPLFSQVCELCGVEGALMLMLTEPALYEALLDKVFEFRYECFARLLDACGDAMPIFDTGDDFATQRGLMISPEHWRRFLKPRYAGIFELGMSRGKVVWFHSCGDISAVLSDLIDIGMNVWETVQLHTLPMSPEVFKREYGRHLTFFGGINTQQLPFATPGQIREEVVRCIEVLGEGGGYICGPDHHIKPDVPGENAVALYDAARSFRRPHYTL